MSQSNKPKPAKYLSTAALKGELQKTRPDLDWMAVDHMSKSELLIAVNEGRSMKSVKAQEEASPKAAPLFIGMPGTKDYIFDGHAGAGPSGADRWMTCTASLGANRSFLETLSPNQQKVIANASTAARQGTTAHAAAEALAGVITGAISAEEAEVTMLELAIDPEADDEAYTPEMGEAVSEFVDLVKILSDEGRKITLERRVSATIPLMTVDGNGDPNLHEMPGSADLTAEPTPEYPSLVIGDYKHGNGIYVEAEANSQMRIYALAVLEDMADEEGNLPADLVDVEYYIIQPRLGGIKQWTETIDDLIDWRDDVLSPALTEALGGLKGGAKFTPSDKACQFCLVRGSCPALVEQRLVEAADLFDTIIEAEYTDGPGSFPEADSLSNDRLGELLAQVEGLTKIKDDLKAEAQRRLHRGAQVKGYKLVNYSPKREWAPGADEALDPDNVDEDLMDPRTADLLWDRKIKSPTQALAKFKQEGIDGEKLIGSMIIKPEPRPVVAPEGDRRKDWAGKPPEQMFDVEED